MIKIFLLVSVAVLVTMIGVFLSAGKKKTMNVFGELYEFNEQLLLNMKFARKPLNKVAENFKYMPSVLNGETVLKGKDGEIIREYISSLGKTDPLSQIDYLNERQSALRKYKEDSIENYKKYSSLYIKIFFMLGVLAAVMLA